MRSALAFLALSLAGCGAGTDTPELPVNKGNLDLTPIRADAKLKAIGPAGWHRVALYGNWDFVEPAAWRWIVSQPDCEKATALVIFWKAQPDFYYEHGPRERLRPAEVEMYDLIMLIRDRWRAGAYTRSEFGFDPDRDADRDTMARLRKLLGKRLDSEVPASMFGPLPGKHPPNDTPMPGVFKL